MERLFNRDGDGDGDGEIHHPIEIETTSDRFETLNLNMMPAFAIHFEKIDPSILLQLTNKFLSQKIPSNPVEGNFIVGLLPTQKSVDEIIDFYISQREESVGITLCIGIPSEISPTTVVYDKKREMLDIGSSAIVAAVRALQEQSWFYRSLPEFDTSLPESKINAYAKEILFWRHDPQGFLSKKGKMGKNENKFFDRELWYVKRLYQRGLVESEPLFKQDDAFKKSMFEHMSVPEKVDTINVANGYALEIDFLRSTRFFSSVLWEDMHPLFVQFFVEIEDYLQQLIPPIYFGYSRLTESMTMYASERLKDDMQQFVNSYIQICLDRLWIRIHNLESKLRADASNKKLSWSARQIAVDKRKAYERFFGKKTTERVADINQPSFGIHTEFVSMHDMELVVIAGSTDVVSVPKNWEKKEDIDEVNLYPSVSLAG